MLPKLREFFDLRLEHVLAGLPERITGLLDEVPLHVEDHPSEAVMRQVGVVDRGALCGLYTGIPLTERSVEQTARLPDVVTIYREGILRASENAYGELTETELLHQIHITLLHELAHHHGLDEEEIAELGYG